VKGRIETGLIVALGSLLLLIPAGATGATHSSTAPIRLPPPQTAGPLLPYPSTIAVVGELGTVTHVRVTIKGIAHGDMDEVEAMVVGPGGGFALLMSTACSGFDTQVAPPATFTFDDAAASPLPQDPPCPSGTYKPGGHSTPGHNFPYPAPPDPYPADYPKVLSVFNGTQPNGLWHLFVTDSVFSVTGSIEGGWDLELTTTGAPSTKKKCKRKKKHHATAAKKKHCKKKHH
jgi:hypothetical protein